MRSASASSVSIDDEGVSPSPSGRMVRPRRGDLHRLGRARSHRPELPHRVQSLRDAAQSERRPAGRLRADDYARRRPDEHCGRRHRRPCGDRLRRGDGSLWPAFDARDPLCAGDRRAGRRNQRRAHRAERRQRLHHHACDRFGLYGDQFRPHSIDPLLQDARRVGRFRRPTLGRDALSPRGAADRRSPARTFSSPARRRGGSSSPSAAILKRPSFPAFRANA